METEMLYSEGEITYPNANGVSEATKMYKVPSIEILVGNAALRALTDPIFESEWELLKNSCPWGSVFQSKAYVSTWYNLYTEEYLPIIVRAKYKGKLVGLLTMVRRNGQKLLLVAGARDAHYQVWLAEPSYGEAFIKQAVLELRKTFPNHDINFYNTPPLTPLSWAEKDPFWSNCCTVRSFKRPLMDLRSPGIHGILNSKSLRKRLNQLKKLGQVEFEHVTSLERYTEVMDELADQFDFRKAAKYNWTEFRNDSLKKQFLLGLYREGLLNVTLLKLNNEIIASITDTIGHNKWIHGTEIATHSCFYAKYSPGILNFILLGQQLANNGYQVYDLTPGSDLYKTRLSNAHDYVHGLYITSSVKTYFRNNIVEPLRIITRSTLKYSGITPKQVKDKSRQLQYYLRETPSSLLPKLLQDRLSSPLKTAQPSLVPLSPIKTTIYPNIKRYSLGDLLNYRPSNGRQNKWDFLAEAMRRLEVGELPYTLSQNGSLLFCCWLSRQQPSAAQDINPIPEGASILQSFYSHADAGEGLLEFARNVAQLIIVEGKSHMVYVFSKEVPIIRQLQA